jgi:thiamine biosynthesis lipoprotein
MGTTWSAVLYAASSTCAPQVQRAIQDALDHVVAEMSPWLPHSALSRFNAAPAGTWHTLPANFFAVLNSALSVARMSDGAFDPTIGALVNAWGFGPDGECVPTPSVDKTASLLARSGWRSLQVDIKSRSVRQPGLLHIDLCGIAKGFGVDQAARALGHLGVRDFLIEVGGELRGDGVKPDGTPWWVAVEQPPADGHGQATASDIIVALNGLSIATSGDFRRFIECGGRRYAHTINPRTGKPVENRIAAVTMLHECCMQADALATAMMVMGEPEAIAFATRHRIAARIVSRGALVLSERLSPEFEHLLRDDLDAPPECL